MVVESQPSTQTRPKLNPPKYWSWYSSHTGTGSTHMNLSNITSSTNNTSLSNPTLNSLSINSSRLKPASLLSHSAAPPKQSLSSHGKNLPTPLHVPHPAPHSHGSTASNPLANAWLNLLPAIKRILKFISEPFLDFLIIPIGFIIWILEMLSRLAPLRSRSFCQLHKKSSSS